MKNLLMLLVLVNVFYYLWGRYIADPIETGVVIVDISQLASDLKLSQPVDEGGSLSRTVVSNESSSNSKSNIGRSCASLGPFKTSSEANMLVTEYVSRGTQVRVREVNLPIFIGHWVQIRDIVDEQTGNQIVVKLRDGGIREAYLVTTEEQGLKISLGLFEERSRAEKLKADASSMQYVADISPRMRDELVYFIDIELSLSETASALVQKYGEDIVLLRAQATCPWDN